MTVLPSLSSAFAAINVATEHRTAPVRICYHGYFFNALVNSIVLFYRQKQWEQKTKGCCNKGTDETKGQPSERKRYKHWPRWSTINKVKNV
jgi:hypothetical protein